MRIVVSIRHPQPSLPRSYRSLYRLLVLAGADACGERAAAEALFSEVSGAVSFAVFLPGAVFGPGIALRGQTRLILSAAREADALLLHRACEALCGHEVLTEETRFAVQRVRLCPNEPCALDHTEIRMLSPLVLLRPDTTLQPRMASIRDADLTALLQGKVSAMLCAMGRDCAPAEGLALSPLADAREVHFAHGGRTLRGMIGSFALCGDPALLSLLRESGIGDLRGEGCGLFEWCRRPAKD